jgi:hypothetical protein
MSKPHAWRKLKGIQWAVCSQCKLLRLRNDASQRAARRPCPGEPRLAGVSFGRVIDWKEFS